MFASGCTYAYADCMEIWLGLDTSIKPLGYRNSNNYLPPLLMVSYLESYTSSGHTVNAVKTGKQLAAPLTAELLLIADDYTMEGPTACTNPTSGPT